VPDPLAAIPTTITAGDSVAVTLVRSAYPASAGWACTWALAGPGVFSTTATADGDAHALTVATTQTATLAAGAYNWSLRMTNGSTSLVIERGTLTVTADYTTYAAGEGVSYWQTLKEAAEAALTQLMAGGAVQMATVMGRQMMFRSPADCLKVIAMCEARLITAAGGTFGVPVRFDVRGMR
jgi:hypothetical protein